MGSFGLAGNRELKIRLAAALQQGRTSHSYLLCGPQGSGKRTLARYLAAAMQCTEPSAPCGNCAQCRKTLNGNHPDVIVVDDPDHKIIPVDLIREARADAFLRPNEGRKKIYMLPRAQDMNEAGQNSLLKIIEEPPPYGVFLLMAENSGKMLPTIRSRCVELRLEPVPAQEAVDWLQKRHPDVPVEELEHAVLRSGGYLGQAEKLLNGGILDPKTEEFVRVYGQKDGFGLRRLLCSMERTNREKMCEILQQWISLATEAVAVRSGLPGSSQAVALGRKRTVLELKETADLLKTALQHCEANVGTGHLCGWLAVRLSR